MYVLYIAKKEIYMPSSEKIPKIIVIQFTLDRRLFASSYWSNSTENCQGDVSLFFLRYIQYVNIFVNTVNRKNYLLTKHETETGVPTLIYSEQAQITVQDSARRGKSDCPKDTYTYQQLILWQWEFSDSNGNVLMRMGTF
jgi:hypothetical protein